MVNRLTGAEPRVFALSVHFAAGAAAICLILGASVTSSGTACADQPPSQSERARQTADEHEMLERARRERLVNIGEATSADTVAQEKKRQEELQRLSDKLRRASANRVPKPIGPVDTPWTTEIVVAAPVMAPESRSALGHTPAQPATDDSRVTVLMVLKPGNTGIRRFEKTADPILCARDGCYISRGGEAPARFISLGRSLGAVNTFGTRAGACNHKTACVFRGVDVGGADAILQPVDLKVMVHDRRNMSRAFADVSCKVDLGRLACGRPIVGTDYVMWVVPERVAEQAGSVRLQQALDLGLQVGVTRAELPWQRD